MCTWSRNGDGDGNEANRMTMMHRVSSHDLSRSTIQQSVLNLVNCIVGAGVLGYPYCFKSSGYMLATVIMLVCLVACRFSYQLMLYCTQLTSRRTFEDMAEQATGQLGKLTITLCVAALNLGSIVAYLNILADVLSSVAGTIIPPGAEPSRSVFLAGVTLFGALPVALIVRDHHVMASFSMASVGFIVLFACVIVLFACLPTLPYVAAAHGEIRMWRMDGLLVAFPVMAYSFTAHPYYLGIFTSMQKPTQAGMLHVTDTVRCLAPCVSSKQSKHAWGLRGAYERAVKLCYGLSILGSVPLVILPFYNIVLPWVGLESSHRPAAGMPDTRMKSRQSDDEEEVAASTHPHSPSPLGFQGSTSRSGRISDDPVMRAGPHALGLNGSGAVKRGHTSAVQHTALEQPLPPALEALGEGQATDIVDLRLQHDGHHEEIAGSLSQHVLVVSIVLGMAMASAIWVPNVEFIFGLTGATASVIISYIMPALIFIRLVAQSPELTAASIAFTNTK
ncbi:Aa_trans domain-containing protein, partial [Haematococcus lacustris]